MHGRVVKTKIVHFRLESHWNWMKIYQSVSDLSDKGILRGILKFLLFFFSFFLVCLFLVCVPFSLIQVFMIFFSVILFLNKYPVTICWKRKPWIPKLSWLNIIFMPWKWDAFKEQCIYTCLWCWVLHACYSKLSQVFQVCGNPELTKRSTDDFFLEGNNRQRRENDAALPKKSADVTLES